MKKIILTSWILALYFPLHAQIDSLPKGKTDGKTDTVRIGNLIILKNANKEHKDEISKDDSSLNSLKIGSIEINKNRVSIDAWGGILKAEKTSNGRKKELTIRKSQASKLSNVKTNWFSFDLGYANFRDASPVLLYTLPPGANYIPYVSSQSFKLINTKSSNFNLWIVQQKVNLYEHKLNLKYGFGFEMFNFRFDQPISFRNDMATNMFIDNISFSKNKLFAKYLTVPFQLNFKSNPESKKSFYGSIGLSAGYLLNSRNKQISAERGKQKIDGNFNLNNWRTATIVELGVGGIRLFGSFGNSNLFDNSSKNFTLYPYSIGLRFSNF